MLSAHSCGHFALSFPDITCVGRTVTPNLDEISPEVALFSLSVEPQWSLLTLLTLFTNCCCHFKNVEFHFLRTKVFFPSKTYQTQGHGKSFTGYRMNYFIVRKSGIALNWDWLQPSGHPEGNQKMDEWRENVNVQHRIYSE